MGSMPNRSLLAIHPVESEIMKYGPIRHLGSIVWKRRPIHLTLFLTQKCNGRCPFCFYLSTKGPCPDSNQELSLPEIEKIAANLGSLLWLALSGGEIFLRPDLAEIVRIFYEKNKPSFILLPTNGLLSETIYHKTEEILRSCPQSVVAVKLSLDGPEAIHDRLRGVPGAHKKVRATYDLLVDLLDRYPNFELGINTVFCAANQDRMTEIVETVRGEFKRITTHTVSLIRGEVSEPALKKIDLAKYEETVAMLERNQKEALAANYRFHGARLKSAQDILQRRLIHETMRLNQQRIPCYAGKLSVVVTETGEVYPCESFTMGLGNLRDNGFDLQGLLHGDVGVQQLAAIKRRDCYCTHECSMMMNILFNPRLYPALWREYLAIGS